MRMIWRIGWLIRRSWEKALCALMRFLFARHGKHFDFDVNGRYSFATISVGDDVSLGNRPTILAGRSTVRIGNHVMFGPEVAIFGGNHRTDLVGRFMKDVPNVEKRPEDDRGVVIEDDVWVGARSIILDGVTVGRGSIVGAGSVVRVSVPPYAVVSGNPARVRGFRWDVDGIVTHESALYAASQRYTRAVLEKAQGLSQ